MASAGEQNPEAVRIFWKGAHMLAMACGVAFAIVVLSVSGGFWGIPLILVALIYGSFYVIYLIKKASGDFMSEHTGRPLVAGQLPSADYYDEERSQFLKALSGYTEDASYFPNRMLKERICGRCGNEGEEVSIVFSGIDYVFRACHQCKRYGVFGAG